jgi:hypothetical protein
MVTMRSGARKPVSLAAAAALLSLGACSGHPSATGASGAGAGTSTAGSGSGGGGTAGNGAAGGAVPVGACDALPADGTWQAISPPQITDTAAVIVDPFDPATVWLGTCHGSICNVDQPGGIYKSTDCGSTWQQVNTGTNGDMVTQGSEVSMAVDPVARGVLYTADIYGAQGVWKSANGGVDWTPLFPATSEVAQVVQFTFIDSISMDPTDHLHLVVGTHAICAAPYGPNCEAESHDGGMTWRIVQLPGSSWEEQAGPWVLDATSWLYGAPSGLKLTRDSGVTWTDVSPAGSTGFGGGEVENHEIFRGPDGTYYLTSYDGIVRSSDGLSWSLIPNSGGRAVGFAVGDTHLYSSDQWSGTYHSAKISDPTQWTTFPAPPSPGDQGAPYLAYDAAHHVLYSSNFNGGLWRIVTR